MYVFNIFYGLNISININYYSIILFFYLDDLLMFPYDLKSHKHTNHK